MMRGGLDGAQGVGDVPAAAHATFPRIGFAGCCSTVALDLRSLRTVLDQALTTVAPTSLARVMAFLVSTMSEAFRPIRFQSTAS